MREQQKNKIVLHACCAICSAYPITLLQELGYEPVVYFYNPNIYPEAEYQNRLEAQKKLCKNLGCELIVDDYKPEEFYNVAKGLENQPEKGLRCDKCFELRLFKTAQFAKNNGITEFTTSIVISPHKNFQKLAEIGQKIAEQFGIRFKAIDFKKQDGFLKTNRISKELGLYRQNYCGCRYSIHTKEKLCMS